MAFFPQTSGPTAFNPGDTYGANGLNAIDPNYPGTAGSGTTGQNVPSTPGSGIAGGLFEQNPEYYWENPAALLGNLFGEKRNSPFNPFYMDMYQDVLPGLSWIQRLMHPNNPNATFGNLMGNTVGRFQNGGLGGFGQGQFAGMTNKLLGALAPGADGTLTGFLETLTPEQLTGALGDMFATMAYGGRGMDWANAAQKQLQGALMRFQSRGQIDANNAASQFASYLQNSGFLHHIGIL